ncbi:MAG TPA: DUF1206 domain-containing protein, partial [Solirubrobacteraceae bacterium]|nr:DUF1206 domain-containing protein [Solirubrobacteraceae bacterium]
ALVSLRRCGQRAHPRALPPRASDSNAGGSNRTSSLEAVAPPDQPEPGERLAHQRAANGAVGCSVTGRECGYFLVRTAITYHPGSAVGVDTALARLHHQAFGPWVVGLVGVGLVGFAAFSLYEARYRRL